MLRWCSNKTSLLHTQRRRTINSWKTISPITPQPFTVFEALIRFGFLPKWMTFGQLKDFWRFLQLESFVSRDPRALLLWWGEYAKSAARSMNRPWSSLSTSFLQKWMRFIDGKERKSLQLSSQKTALLLADATCAPPRSNGPNFSPNRCYLTPPITFISKFCPHSHNMFKNCKNSKFITSFFKFFCSF